jgi:hypothetical protein
MSTSGIDYTELRAALRERIERLAVDLLGEPTHAPRHKWRWGRRWSFALTLTGEHRGCWKCWQSGEGGGPIELIMHARSCSFADAVAWGAAWRGGAAIDHTPRRCEEPRSTKRDHLELARVIWCEAVDARGTPAEAYLRSRGLELPGEPVLRFHPRCPHGKHVLPAMIAQMSCPLTGEARGIHRTFIKPDGSGKADVASPKMMLGPAGVIRLYEPEGCGLGITEGIEDALAIAQRIGWGPVWAAGSAGAIARFPVLAHRTLNVFCDANDGGVSILRAKECRERWKRAGFEVWVHTPPEGTDWDSATREAVP